MSAGISRSQGFINCIRRRILLLLVNSSPIWHCIPDIHHPGSNKRPKRSRNPAATRFFFLAFPRTPRAWKPVRPGMSAAVSGPPPGKINSFRRRKVILFGGGCLQMNAIATYAPRKQSTAKKSRKPPPARNSLFALPTGFLRTGVSL